MAQVAQARELRERIEGFLTYALDEWGSVPEYTTEFQSWDDVQQLDFVQEWAIRESALDALRDYARRDVLTPEQRGRYEQLEQLVTLHRPAVQQLLAD
jgi:hypothetical protein